MLLILIVFLFVCLFFADIRNILILTNAFNIGVGNITLENYGEWLNYLNKTIPWKLKVSISKLAIYRPSSKRCSTSTHIKNN